MVQTLIHLLKASSRNWSARLIIGSLILVLAGCDFNPAFSEFDQPISKEAEDENACGGEGILCNVAGIAGEPGSAGLGADALLAQLNFPIDMAKAPITVAQTGDLFIVDQGNHAIRKLTPDGTLFPHIGSGEQGDTDRGSGQQILLNSPSDIIIGYDGHFYVTDWLNSKIKVINSIDLDVMAVYGRENGFGGDGGPANDALLDLPSSVSFDPDGLVYISDQRNQRIRRVDNTQTITTFAGGYEGLIDGNREEAAFHFPMTQPPALGGKTSMNTHDWVFYIADTENHCIRRINFFTNRVTTIVGTGEAGYSGDGGNARNAQLNRPTDVIFREDHHIYIADSGNNVIRKVDPFGNISTLVGTGMPGSSPDGTTATQAQLDTPMGIYYDEINHILYIADTNNHQIKRVKDL